MFQNIALFNLFSSKTRGKSIVSQERDIAFVCEFADELKEEVKEEVVDVEEPKTGVEELSEKMEEDEEEKTEEELEEGANIQDLLNITESSGERYDVDEATHTESEQETKKPNSWISVAFKGFRSFCSLKH